MSSSNGSIHVLHVDDEPSFGEMVGTFLEREDDRITVRAVTSPTDGLDALAEHDIDCVVSDYDMPELNGIKFLEDVRETHPDIPFILYTGKGSEEVASEAISKGVTDYLQKGSGADHYQLLVNRITNAVDSYRSQRTLAERNRELQSYERMINSMQEAACIYDSEGRFELVNEYLADWYGTTREELEGTRSSLIPSLRDRSDGDPYRELLDGDRDRIHGEIDAEFPGHGHAVLEYYLTPLVVDGSIEGTVGVARDITEQKRNERELIETNTLQSTVFETLPYGILAETESREILAVNERFIELFGLPETSEEIIGTDCRQLVGSVSELFADPESFARDIDSAVDRGEPIDGEELVLEDGRTFERSYRPIGLPGGDGHLWAYRDVTDRIARERQLEALNRATRELMGAETREEVTGVGVGVAQAVLELDANAIYLSNEDRTELEPVAATDTVRDLAGELPTVTEPESAAWRVYQDGEARTADDVHAEGVLHDPDSDVRSELHIPIGEHGVLIAGSPTAAAFDQQDVLLGEALGGNIATALAAVEQTEQLRQRERELKREQAFIEQSLDTLDDIFYAVDTDGDFERWNEALPELTGYTDDEIGSMNALEFFEGEHRTAVENSIREILETGFHAIEAAITTVDGRSVPHEFRGVRMTDAAGDPIGIIGIARDITERKKREEELERQRSLLEAQLEATLDGILIVDSDGQVITYNQQFVDLWQIPEDVVDSRSDEELVDWVADHQLSNPESFRERVEYLYDNPHERSRDEITLDDGRVFERFSAPVVGDNGSYYGRTWLFRDITDLKERERQLERERDRLDEFASIVSHDLRNPLSVATGRLELIRETHDSENLDAIETALDRMERIIEDVLRLAREGRDIGSTEEVDLTEVIETAWMLVADDRHGVELVASEADSAASIIADPDRLAQLAENVLRNAVEHGGQDVTVTVGRLEDGFYIEDDGPGIPEDNHDEVFTTGYSTSQEGIGVGLSIVKRIVDAHGWEIRVTEGTDGGARFEITGVDVTV